MKKKYKPAGSEIHSARMAARLAVLAATGKYMSDGEFSVQHPKLNEAGVDRFIETQLPAIEQLAEQVNKTPVQFIADVSLTLIKTLYPRKEDARANAPPHDAAAARVIQVWVRKDTPQSDKDDPKNQLDVHSI